MTKLQQDLKPLLIIDLSNIVYAMFFSAMKETKVFYTGFDQYDYCQYLIYKRIQELKSMNKTAEIIIAVDSSSWRSKYYKYYKCRRKLQRAKLKYDMDEMFAIMNKTVKALKEYFPYKTIQCHGAEADDIIGTLVCYFKNSGRDIIIISRDKDFMQLQQYDSVKQYDPVSRKWIECGDPYNYLVSHIISGDAGDDITNILSDRDTFVTDGKRQKACGTKKIEYILDYGLDKFLDENLKAKKLYKDNRKLIELSEEMIPKDIQEEIKFVYNNYKKNKIKPYILLGEYFSANEHLKKFNVLDFI